MKEQPTIDSRLDVRRTFIIFLCSFAVLVLQHLSHLRAADS
jgi:hypothetical protein